MQILSIKPYSYAMAFRGTSPKVKKNSVNNSFNGGYSTISSLTAPNYIQNLSFTRSYKEHTSWGAKIDPKTKNVSFKIFAFPDAKKVDVKVFDRTDNEKFKTYPMKNMGEGVFQTPRPLSPDKAKAGDKYSYIITKADGTKEEVKDPYAARQGNQNSDDFLKYSILYDHSEFNWQNQGIWKKSGERIVRNPSPDQLGVREASIYEMHIDTFTQEGTYEAAKEKLHKVKNLGFNAIELMPQENTFSFNWGYDGVDKFAPPEHRGGPDKLKELIDYAHGIGLNVIMDYVPNHLGPDGAQLGRTGPYLSGPNDFGDAFNFQGQNSKYVRDYIVNAGLNWLDNYKVDGLRLDMTKYMNSDFTMKEIAAEINYHFPDAFLIAEDSRVQVNTDGINSWYDPGSLHDKRVTFPLNRDETCIGKSESKHCDYINSIDNSVENDNQQILKNLGYDSEWDFPYFHALKDALYDPDANKLWHLVETAYQSQHAVKYVTSHDETGNFDGTRPVVKLLVPKLNLSSNIVLEPGDYRRAEEYYELKKKKDGSMTPQKAVSEVTSQKVQLVCEKLVGLLVEGKLDKYKNVPDIVFYEEVLKPLSISQGANITYRNVLENFKESIAQAKMAEAFTYAIPGPKMVFQGEEKIDITPFRFFRQFENPKSEPYLYVEKGYTPGKTALKASKADGIEYSDKQRILMKKFSRLIKDLNTLNKANPALTKGYLTLKEDGNKGCVVSNGVIGLHTKDEASGNEFFVVTNLRDNSYPSGSYNEYGIQFPKGKWIEVLNTDSPRYGGSGKYINAGYITGFGINENDSHSKCHVRLSGYSTAYFKRIA